jgi:hypothetical protein
MERRPAWRHPDGVLALRAACVGSHSSAFCLVSAAREPLLVRLLQNPGKPTPLTLLLTDHAEVVARLAAVLADCVNWNGGAGRHKARSRRSWWTRSTGTTLRARSPRSLRVTDSASPPPGRR